jgi:alginate O-acetyltransferase complex protein AlgI
MLFSSFTYMLMFLPLVLLGAVGLRRLAGAKASQAWVLVASIVFYGWFKPSNLPFLLGSIVVNWALAAAMDRRNETPRKRLLQLGLVLNIGYLCVFKYVNFFLGSISFLLPKTFHFPELEFPLGISFFTLMQIMYLVDTHDELLPAMGLFDYATFVSFFPYVIAGPISRAKRIQHQFKDFGGKEGQTGALLSRGLFLFVIGLAKKALLATVFASIADAGFNTRAHLSAMEAWLFSFAYAMQIYFDFSGYSDMAMGSAMMLGIEIPQNFRRPFRSLSLIEFWTRWHISLSQFITNYLYTPALRAMWKISLFTSALATLLAMTIAGLWHGPAWTFIVYGVIHGVGLGVNQYWRKKKMPVLPKFVSWLLTFVVVDIALLFFRASDLHSAFRMVAAMVDPRHGLAMPTLHAATQSLSVFSRYVVVGIGVFAAFFWKSSDELSLEFKPTLRYAVAAYSLLVASCLFMVFNVSQDFLYFKF